MTTQANPTISEIISKAIATMTIVELQDARQECLRNGQPGGAWVLQNEIARRVARQEHNQARLAAVLAATK